MNRHIDWMALNGINLPLAQTGQEEIWRRVWRNFGLTEVKEAFWIHLSLLYVGRGGSALCWTGFSSLGPNGKPARLGWTTAKVVLEGNQNDVSLLSLQELAQAPS